MAHVVYKGGSSRQKAVYGGNVPDELRPPLKTKEAQSTNRNLSGRDVPIDILPKAVTKINSGFQKKKKKDFKSDLRHQRLKQLKYSKLVNPDVDKNLIDKDAANALKKKLKIINILPPAKNDLKKILKDEEKVSNLVKNMSDWLDCNNDKTLEMFNIFRKLGQNNCMTYPQFIGTMINLEAPFRMLWLCALVIHLSSQKPGLISEEDIKKLQSDERIVCNLCGFGKPERVQARTGPFGIGQISFELLKTMYPVKTEEPSDVAELFTNNPNTNEFHTSPSRENLRFKTALVNLKQQTEKSNKKPAWRQLMRRKTPEFASVAERISRTRDMLVDWSQYVKKTERSGEAGGLTTKRSRLMKESFEKQDEFNKPLARLARKKTPEFASVAEKTVRTRALLINWRQNVNKPERYGKAGGPTMGTSRLIKRHSTHLKERKIKRPSLSKHESVTSGEDNIGNNTTTSLTKAESSRDMRFLGKGKQKLLEIFNRMKANTNEEMASESRTTRFKKVSAVVKGGLKADKSTCPRLADVAVTMANKRGNPIRPPPFKRHQLSFLDIPSVDEDILRAFTLRLPKVLFVLIHLRSIIYDKIFSCPAHFSVLLTDDDTLTCVADSIKKANDIRRANVYISPCRLSFRQTLLPLEKTLRQCGYKGYCKAHPLKITLYYDFVITYDFDFMDT